MITELKLLIHGALYGNNKLDKLGTSTMMESRNPNIVRILEEKGSVIENRHSGIPTMRREMAKYNLPDPEFAEERGAFKVVFRNSKIDSEINKDSIGGQESGQESGQEGGQQSGQVNDQIEEYRLKVLEYCVTPKSMNEIKQYLGLSSRRYVREKIVKPLIDGKKLEYTNKDYIRVNNQKYVTIK